MFNIFKRDKQFENKDQEPAAGDDLPTAAPDQEVSTAPFDPTETSAEESPAPAIDPPSSPSETGTPNQSELNLESSPSAAQDETGKKDEPPVSSSPESIKSAEKAKIPDISTAVSLSAPHKSLVYRLFSPETQLGRIMRPLLRWLAAISGLFALGLLAGYILLYQPTQRELDDALVRLATTNQIVSQKDQGLESAQTGLDQAQLSLNQVQDKLNAAASENALLIVMVDISNARVALVGKDGAAAKAAIEQAQSNLNQALPYIQSQDKVLSDLLKSRLDLSAKELVSDPGAAQSDLGKLSADLANLHQKIFGE